MAINLSFWYNDNVITIFAHGYIIVRRPKGNIFLVKINKQTFLHLFEPICLQLFCILVQLSAFIKQIQFNARFSFYNKQKELVRCMQIS